MDNKAGLKIYLDTSVYNWPAVILQMIEAGDVQLVSSSVLAYENSRNPFPERKAWVNDCLELAEYSQSVNELILSRAEDLEGQGLKPIDALHLACAEAARLDYCLTCDDRVIRH